MDEVISETDGKAIVRIGKKTFELATATKCTPVAKSTTDWNALADKLQTTQTILKARAQGEANREFVRDNTTPAPYIPRTQAQADYADKQARLGYETRDEATEALSPVIARAGIAAGGLYNVEVEQGEGKRSHLFAAEVKLSREQKLQRAEEAVRERTQAQLEARLAVTKAADDKDDELLALIRNAALFKGDQ